jgi:hypothetical protein
MVRAALRVNLRQKSKNTRGATQSLQREEDMRARRIAYCSLVVLGVFILSIQVHAFPISTQPLVGEAATSGASDGNGHFLVGVEPLPDSKNGPIQAVLLDQDGNILKNIDAGRIGCCTSGVAFDDTNFLVMWEDSNGNYSPGYKYQQVWGLFIDTYGEPVGDPFSISSQGIAVDGTNHLVFGGGKYFVVYTKLIDPERGDEWDNRYIAGTLVDPNGTLSEEFQISGGYGHLSAVAYDGTNFFVVWVEDSEDKEVRGRFISPDGTLGTEVSINASGFPSDNPPSIRYGLDSYLVAFNDERSAGNWSIMGQLVGTDGSLVGEPFGIRKSGSQIVPTVGFDGEKFLVAYNDISKDTSNWGVCDSGEGTCWDLKAIYVSAEGTLMGNPFTISAGAGMEFGGIGSYDETAGFLALINKCGTRIFSSKCDAYGQFISPSRSYVGLLSPASGQAVASGSTYSIRWAASSDIAKFTLKYSMDKGTTWTTIATEQTGTSYDWNVPIPRNNKKQCSIKIIGYGSDDTLLAQDKTDGPLTVEVVKLTYPDGGETLSSPGTEVLTWTVNETRSDVASVKLYYTKNSGTTWIPITALPGSAVEYEWTLPTLSVPKTKCKVKVVLKDSAGKVVGSDTSDAYFTIGPE